MARLLPEHFKENGKPKRGFATAAEAARYITGNSTRTKIYRCTFCGEFHIGHWRTRKERREAA